MKSQFMKSTLKLKRNIFLLDIIFRKKKNEVS